MKIHYTATVWHGGFYEFFAAALRSLGHDVAFFNDGGTRSQAFFARVGSRLPKFHYAAGDMFRAAVSRDWLAHVRAARPDLIVLEHAANILPETVREARELERPIFYWMDSPAAGAQAKDALAAMQYADTVFTVDRSPAWMTMLYGPGEVKFLPLAGDDQTFHPISPAPKKEYDVVFVGSVPPQSGDGYLRAKVIASIPERYRVAVCGAGFSYWTRYFPELAHRIVAPGQLKAADINMLYNRSKLLLNIHSTWHFTSVSARTFEAALAGTFQLVDHRADHDELFPKGSLVTFRSPKDILPLLDRYLAPEADHMRATMAATARTHVLAHHTWRHRAEEMLRSLSAGGGSSSGG